MIVLGLVLAIPALLIGFATGRSTSPTSRYSGLILMMVLALPVLLLSRFGGLVVGVAWGIGAMLGALAGRTWRSWTS
jgi:hypothetical protein